MNRAYPGPNDPIADIGGGGNGSSASVAPATPALRGISNPLLTQVLWVARRRKWIILAAIAAVVALGLVVTLMTTRLYTATARIEIAREAEQVVELQSERRPSFGVDMEFYQTQYGLLRSEALAERGARDLKLTRNAAFYETFKVDIADVITQKKIAPNSPAAERQRLLIATKLLLANIAIDPVRGSRLVDIRFTSASPQLSAQIANAWSTNFIQTNLDRRFEATSYARRFLEDRLGNLRQKLEESERTLVNYASQQGIINLPGSLNRETGVTSGERSLLADEVEKINEEAATATADRIRAESRLQELRGTGASTEALQNPAIAQLRQRRAELSAEYAKLMVQFEPDYPPAKAIAQQVAALDTSITREERRVSESLRNSFEASAARETALTSRVGSLKGDLTDLRRRTIQYNIYQREVDTNRQLYDGLLQQYKEIGIAGAVGTNNVSVVDAAMAPTRPSTPNLPLNMLISVMLGVIAGAALAWAMEQIDEGITDPSAVGTLLEAPFLGAVPYTNPEDTLDALGLPRSGLVEAYLAIQTSLELATANGVPRTFSVTSTRPREGKSLSSNALARSLARGGRRVLLIDADMRSPMVHRQFELKNDLGLSNFLAGHGDLDKGVHTSGIANLSIMTAGPHPPNAADLLSGDGLRKLLDRLLERFDHVVVDSPPVMGLADAPLIANSVDGTVYVVESRSIRASLVRQALNRLLSANINLLGVVLTKFDAKHSQYGYGYDYGYGYGASSRDAAE